MAEDNRAADAEFLMMISFIAGGLHQLAGMGLVRKERA